MDILFITDAGVGQNIFLLFPVLILETIIKLYLLVEITKTMTVYIILIL